MTGSNDNSSVVVLPPLLLPRIRPDGLGDAPARRTLLHAELSRERPGAPVLHRHRGPRGAAGCRRPGPPTRARPGTATAGGTGGAGSGVARVLPQRGRPDRRAVTSGGV